MAIVNARVIIYVLPVKSGVIKTGIKEFYDITGNINNIVAGGGKVIGNAFVASG